MSPLFWQSFIRVAILGTYPLFYLGWEIISQTRNRLGRNLTKVGVNWPYFDIYHTFKADIIPSLVWKLLLCLYFSLKTKKQIMRVEK